MIVDAEDLRDFMLDETLVDLRAEFACNAASDTVKNYLDAAVEASEDTVEILGSGTDAILLPEMIARSVSQVTEDEEVLDPEDYWLGAGGVLYRRGACWSRGRIITVTFTSGWVKEEPGSGEVELPYDIRLVTLRLARRVYVDMGMSGTDGLTQETIGAYSYTREGGADASELLDSEQRILDRYAKP